MIFYHKWSSKLAGNYCAILCVVSTLVVKTQMFKLKMKTLSSRTKTQSKTQKHNSRTDWLKTNHYSRNRVICSHENDDLLIKIIILFCSHHSMIQQSTHNKDW